MSTCNPNSHFSTPDNKEYKRSKHYKLCHEQIQPIPLVLDQQEQPNDYLTKHHTYHCNKRHEASHHHHKSYFKFMKLPQYIQEYIFGCLTPRECCCATLVCKQWRIMATCDSVWSKIAEDSFRDCTNWLEFYKKFCSAPKCSWINLVMNSCKVPLTVCHAFVGAASVSPTRAIVITSETSMRQIQQLFQDSFRDDPQLQLSYSFACSARTHLHVVSREVVNNSCGGPSSRRTQSPCASSRPPRTVQVKNSGSGSSSEGISPPTSPQLIPTASSPAPSSPSPTHEITRCSVCSLLGARSINAPCGYYDKLTAGDVGIRAGDSLELLVYHS